jgi:hypothetical protein
MTKERNFEFRISNFELYPTFQYSRLPVFPRRLGFESRVSGFELKPAFQPSRFPAFPRNQEGVID